LYILCRGALATEIRRYNWDDEDLGTIGGPGTTDGKFLWPGAILADEAENLYVSDEGCHRISLFSRDGTFLGKWGEQGAGPGQLNRPTGVTVDTHGDIYVADWGNNRVQLFTPEGHYVQKFLGEATLSKCARAYVLANPKPLRLREMANLEPQKLFHGPVSVRVDTLGR